MAKRIKWSPLAERKFDEILEYCTNRNKSETFNEKLIDLFEDATKLVANFPEMGRSTDIENVRQKISPRLFNFLRGRRRNNQYTNSLGSKTRS